MPPRTRGRSRRNATKRTILGAVNENEVSGVEPDCLKKSVELKIEQNTIQQNGNECNNRKSFEIPKEFDGSSVESVKILLQDLKKEVRRCQESLSIKASMALKDQQQVFFLESMKLPRSIKNMTIKDFNEKYFTEGGDIGKDIDDIAKDGNDAKTTYHAQNMVDNDTPMMGLETPARPLQSRMDLCTPGTAIRTVKRGEALYSARGSPVDPTDKGDLVATVSKKRRGQDLAVFDINVGEGCYVSLSDPSSLQQLDDEMKSTAKTQLKVLQDQMARLMESLGK